MKNNAVGHKIEQIQAEISFIQFHSTNSTKEKQHLIKQLEKKLMRYF